MPDSTYTQEWQNYFVKEKELALKSLVQLGFEIDFDNQVHAQGERYLMSGKKLVLVGTEKKSGEKVIIKVSSDQEGIQEIEHERRCRQTLHRLKFAGATFLSPKEILHTKKNGLTVIVQEYIEQPTPFLTRPLEEQFELALRAFKMQESVHAATYAHAQVIKKIFGNWTADDYLTTFAQFKESIARNAPSCVSLLEETKSHLHAHKKDIERYTGFLTHEDFALHNLRIRNDDIYLIDYSSLRFGNKHESWARFLNFMVHHNRELEQALLTYTRDNRADEENLSLRLMRIYKVVQLIDYHAAAALRSTDNLQKLSNRRVVFWSDVLEALLSGNDIPEQVIEEYKKDRDALRSNEEKERQRELQQL